MRRLLVAVDGSDCSMRAARLAGQLSRCLESEVDVLHAVARAPIVPPRLLEEFERIEHTHVTQDQLLQAAGGAIVDEAAALVRDAGGTVRKQEVVSGRPAREIVEYADENAADAIVMGRRGLGGVRSLVVGSVSHEVAHLTNRTLVTTE